MEDWVAELQRGRPDPAWDLFLTRYRRLIFAAIRHYAQDYDDVMDVFARVCEALREDDLRRLRTYIAQPDHRARFSTWLVAVVRHLTVDWFRQRDGRRRLSAVAEGLPPLRRRIFEHVFLEHRSHLEAFELIRSRRSARPFLQRVPGRAAGDLPRRDRRAAGSACCANWARRRRPRPSPMTPEATLTAESRALVEQALCALSAEDRVAVELYVMEELPAADIARTLGLPNAKAVYNRVYRALAAVRAQLEQAGIRREDL